MMNSRFSVSPVIKDGAQKTFDHIGVLIKGLFFFLLSVILITIGLAVANLGLLSTLGSILGQLQKIQECGANEVCKNAIMQPFIQLLASKGIMAIFSLFIIAMACSYLMFGYINYTLRVYDRGYAEFSDLFPSFGRVLKVMLAWCIFTSMVSVGLALLVIPGIYLMIRFGFFSYLILDKNVGVFDSLKMSWRITRGYGGELFVLLCFATVLHTIGGLTIIGMIFIVPLIYVTAASAYRHLLIARIPDKDVVYTHTQEQ